MSYHVGFLYFANAWGNAVEVFNEARTTYNLTNAINSGVKRYGDVLKNAGCEALNYVPCTMSSTGSVTSWQAMATGPTQNPWYVASSAASLEAYGFWVEEWTGLDGAHHVREVTPIGGGRGGAVFGRQSSSHRTMAINVVLMGSSERGLNHLFRWLESTLLNSCAKDSPSMWIREFCPTNSVADITEGLARADDVALIAGLEWAEPPVNDGGCYIRRASFTLGTGSPCLFREPVTQASSSPLRSDHPSLSTTDLDNATYNADLARFIGLSVRVAATMPTPAYGSVSPRITISSLRSPGRVLPQFRIVGLTNPAGASTSEPYRMYPVGCVVTAEGSMEAGCTYIIDVGTGEAFKQSTYKSLEWMPAPEIFATGESPNWSYGVPYPSFLGPDGRLKRWFSFGNCDSGVVVVEPNAIPLSTYLTSNVPSFWTVTIESVARFGCV